MPRDYGSSYPGDFNHDGNVDVMVMAAAGAAVYPGNGDGSLRAPITTSLQHSGWPVLTDDVNGDGASDLTVMPVDVQKGPNSLVLYLSNGDGSFSLRSTLAFNGSLRYYGYGDFNGDHTLDLVIRVFDIDAWRYSHIVWFGDGEGGFGAPVVSPADSNYGNPMKVEDVDGDGFADIREGVAVLRGRGDGTFIFPSDYQNELYAHGDFNADGLIDLVVLAGGTGNDTSCPWTLAVKLNQGDRTFRTTGTYVGGFAGARDINADGKLDLIVTAAGGSAVGFMLGRGDGTFEEGEFYALPQGEFNSIFLADFDNDGKLDLFDGEILLHGTASLFQGRRWYLSSTSATGCGGKPIAVTDIDGDGHADIMTSPGVTYLPGRGDGTFATLRTDATLGTGPAIAADFDGDGKVDVATAESDGSHLYRSKGDGTFEALGSPAPSATHAGDINGDGRQDLLSAGRGSLTVYFSTGTATFGTGIVVTAIPSNAVVMVIRDVDADGRQDILWSDGAITTYNGSSFAMRYLFITGEGCMAVGDLDKDGRPDLVFARYDAIDVYKNYGNLQFSKIRQLDKRTSGPLTGTGVGAGFDGDRHADVALGAGTILGDRQGGFGGGVWGAQNLWQAFEFAAAVDVNGDGLPESIGGGGYYARGTSVISPAVRTSMDLSLTLTATIREPETDGVWMTRFPQTDVIAASDSPYARLGILFFMAGSDAIGFDQRPPGQSQYLLQRMSETRPYPTAVLYSGDGIFATTTVPITRSGVTVTVAPADPSAAIYAYSPTTFNVTISSDALSPNSTINGTVTLLIDGQGTQTKTATRVTQFLVSVSGGAHQVSATYNGDQSLAPGTSAPYAIDVAKKTPSVTLSATPAEAAFGQTVMLRAAFDSSLATGSVAFREGATTLGSATVSNGLAAMNTSTLSSGRHTIVADYSGDSSFTSVTSASIVVAVAVPFGNAFGLEAAFGGGGVSTVWPPVTGATMFDVQRRSSTNDWQTIARTFSTSYLDTTTESGRAYLYRVVAYNSNGATSISGSDFATAVNFTDSTLVAGATAIRAAHFTELRSAIDAVRFLAGLGAYSYSRAVSVGAMVNASDVVEMRNAITEARGTLGYATTVTDPGLTSRFTRIRAVHIQDLRNAVR
jgi:hypothetical protein